VTTRAFGNKLYVDYYPHQADDIQVTSPSVVIHSESSKEEKNQSRRNPDHHPIAVWQGKIKKAVKNPSPL